MTEPPPKMTRQPLSDNSIILCGLRQSHSANVKFTLSLRRSAPVRKLSMFSMCTRAAHAQCKNETYPSPSLVVYMSGVRKSRNSLCGVMRGFDTIRTHPRRFFVYCEDLTRSVDISRPAPENSLVLNNECFLK